MDNRSFLVETSIAPVNILKNYRFAVLLSLLFMVLIYSLLYFSADLNAPADLVNRELDSTLREWLNGRLGIFFNFHFSGPVVWLSIPLGLTLFFRKNNRLIPEYRFILFFAFCTSAFIAIFAYINYRYVTGFIPGLLLIIIFSLSRLYPVSAAKGFLWCLALISVLHSSFYIYAEMAPRYLNRISKTQENDAAKLNNAVFWKSLNDSCVNSVVLVNNLPEYYLHSSLPSVFCWMGGNVFYNASGMHPVLHADSPEELLRIVSVSWNCDFVLSSETLNAYSPVFQNFLHQYASRVNEDQQGHILYRIHATR
jgi:hypothetical protein